VSNDPINDTETQGETPQKSSYEMFLESQKMPMTEFEKKEIKNRKWLEGFKKEKGATAELPRIKEQRDEVP
jgi:hypothetical protein